MGFRTLAFTYVLGGLTFLPLVFVAVLISAWYLLPKVDDAKDVQKETVGEKSTVDGDDVGEESGRGNRSRQASTTDAAASGTFAVLRKYDFQVAITALNARNNSGGSAGGGGNAADGHAGEGNSSSSSESVYQSMYRSVFVGSKNTASPTSILENEDAQQTPAARRKPVSVNIMYIVLRHGHLMLYDSPSQIEVRHVISLAHHNVSLQAGKDAADELDDRRIPEADLFIKRTAIVLTPIDLPNGTMQQSNAQKPPRPIYLFSATSIEKENFYHALLSSRSQPPVPLSLNPDALIKLQSTLHSSSLTPETRALNALLGRVFLGVHHTEYLKDFVLGKIERKLARIQKPSFIPLLHIRSLDLGDAAPVFTNLKLRDLNISGETTISADMRYNGGLSITLLAVAKLDLGPRFKARTVDLVLKASLQRVHGTMLLHIKPPPSNRIWYSFESMPELEVRAEPVVSERKITYGFVLRAIEERVRTAIGEGLVKPNWDDVPMPLIDTRDSHARGGLWSDLGEDEHPELRPESAHVLANRNEKTMSMPSFAPNVDAGSSTGLSTSSDVNLLKLRHSATMPIDDRQSKQRQSTNSATDTIPAPSVSQLPPKPLRSPSITSPSPVVAVDGHTVEPVRSDDPSLRPNTSQRRIWRPRSAATPQQQQKDALDELRDIRARADHAALKPSAITAVEENSEPHHPKEELAGYHDSDDVLSRSSLPSEDSESTISASPRSFSIRSTDSDRSSLATSISSSRGQPPGQRKANILAAAGAATNAARNWGWNAIQKNKGILPRAVARPDQPVPSSAEPMGRGQPLPPPGTPLPGPQKGIWGSVGGVRRKPVPPLPARNSRSGDEGGNGASSSSMIPQRSRSKGEKGGNAAADVEDEFGTWQENVEVQGLGPSGGSSDSINILRTEVDQDSTHGQSGASITEEEDLLELNSDDPGTRRIQNIETQDGEERQKKVPPPLPARPRQTAEEAQSKHSVAPTLSDSKNEENSEETWNDEPDGPGLCVPGDTADAIATENLTTELAMGDEDDPRHIDHSRAIDTKVSAAFVPNSEGTSLA